MYHLSKIQITQSMNLSKCTLRLDRDPVITLLSSGRCILRDVVDDKKKDSRPKNIFSRRRHPEAGSFVGASIHLRQ
jgi:hypothetical protein